MTKEPLQTSLFQTGIVGAQIALALGVLLIDDFPGLLQVMIVLAPAVAGPLWLIFIYQIWNRIPLFSSEPETAIPPHPTPGQAVGRLFIPFYNLYWIFRVTAGFASLCQRIARAADLPAQAAAIVAKPNPRFFAVAVVFLFAHIPVLSWVLTWRMLGQAGRAANAMQGLDGADPEVPSLR